MDIWLDTAVIQSVQQAVRYGLLSGITTNPTLIAQTGRDLEEVLEDLLHHQEGPVTAQVVSNDSVEMVQQGQTLYSISNRFIIKVPVTKNGLEAIHLLSRQGIPTMATVIFHPHQALLASLAGADYVAPYLGRMHKAGIDPWKALQTIHHFVHTYRLKTKVLGASLESIDDVMKCAEVGIYGVTIKVDLFEKLIGNNALTSAAVEQFSTDWKKVKTPLYTP